MIGRQVSHFYIIRSLGSGGMGVVYEAQDTRLPRSVAIKFLKPSLWKDAEAVRRFKREARLASSLNHPNICTVLDVDEGQDESFIAMELLRGRSLRERLTSGPLNFAEILAIATQIADALATAHDQGILHRDITPGNIFITEGGLVKLLDFGLAKHLGSASDDGQVTEPLTQTGAVLGTLHYLAPEQFVPGALVDHRSDLFSLGAVIYQMATGTRPFEAKSKDDVIALIQEQPHIPLRHLAPQHPAHLERVVDRLLAKRPDQRYDTAWALRAELEEIKRRDGHAAPLPVADARHGASVAVLPFRIVGEAGVHISHFRDGLAEDISGRLSQIPGLRVAPRTSTANVATESIREVGKRLGVQAVLEGSVQQATNRVRVSANLVKASNEQSVVPPVRVERQFDDILSVQDNIAREIVEQLAAPIVASTDNWKSQDSEAYHALKRGQHYWKDCFRGGWRQAIEQFQNAVERHDRFALAHLALGAAYSFLGFYCLMKPNLAFSVARESVERALEIDETLASAHAELALIKFGGDWDWDGSEIEFRRAIQLDPKQPFAHIYYSWLLMLLGRDDAAFAEAQAGHALAPSSRFATVGRAQVLLFAGGYDEAIELCNECLRLDPTYVFAIHLRAQCHQLKRMYPDAMTDFEHAATLAGRAPFYLGMLGHCYGQSGMRSKALGLLEELDRQVKEMYVPPQSYVFVYAGLGDRDKALEYQEKAYQDGASPLNYLTPNIRQLYALDPQHKKRLEQMRLQL